MPDVSAVLLSVGEATAERARASVARQTVPADFIEVRDVRPFHRALNEGARRVETPFFLQVDADMVLDETCVERLRSAMLQDPMIGVAVGFLRDPMVGRVTGVKMFRRSCFDGHAFTDSISPDTDFLADIARAGWREVHVLRYPDQPGVEWHTLGDHQPAYDERYTYDKFVMEGARYRYRGDAGGLRWHLALLHRSRHPMAPIARIAMLQGLLSGAEDDRLGNASSDAPLAALQRFMQTRGDRRLRLAPLRAGVSVAPLAVFRAAHRLGGGLVRVGAWPAFQRAMAALDGCGAPLRWVALAGLCRGAGDPQGASLAADVRRLRPLLPPRPWLSRAAWRSARAALTA